MNRETAFQTMITIADEIYDIEQNILAQSIAAANAEEEIARLEAAAMKVVVSATDAAGKPVHSNDEKRKAAQREILAESSVYREKRNELIDTRGTVDNLKNQVAKQKRYFEAYKAYLGGTAISQ